MMVHLLHELVGIRSTIAATRRLYDYTCRQNGSDPNAGYVTPIALDCASRSVELSIDQVTHWLKAQVIGLYDPHATTTRLREMTQHRDALKGTPPQPQTYE